MPTLPPMQQHELDQLCAVQAYFEQNNWLGWEDIDDQGKCLALAYSMQPLNAQHVVDARCIVNPRWEGRLGSVWAYGLHVQSTTGVLLAFVGVNGERTPKEAEQNAVRSRGITSTEWKKPMWETGKVAFASLEMAKRFYTKSTYDHLMRLAGMGRAHLQASQLEQSIKQISTPGLAPRL